VEVSLGYSQKSSPRGEHQTMVETSTKARDGTPAKDEMEPSIPVEREEP
jgi:hypothetical protein